MKNLLLNLGIIILTLLGIGTGENFIYAGGPPPPVTQTIGPTGTFASITAALVNLAANPATGTVTWELQATYVSSVETFPITFTAANLNGISATNTLTIRPETGATGLVITSGAAQTIYLNGAHDVIIDGRPGGLGTTPQLTINNTSTTFGFYPIQYLNATRNTLQYCEITSSNASQLVSPWTGRGAAVYFTSGNSNNTIDNCALHGTASDAGIAARTPQLPTINFTISAPRAVWMHMRFI
jgi:hypothetical protein